MAYTSEQIKAIDQEFRDKVLSENSDMVKQASLPGTTYFRTRIRENAVYRKLLPPVQVTADDFDYNELSDLPSMIVELDFNSEGAQMVSFEAPTTGATFNGRKIRMEFNRIMTRKYHIDKIRLTGYKMPLLDMLYDLMLKDIMDVEDEAWAEANQSIVGNWDDQAAQIAEFGVRRAIYQPFDRTGFAYAQDGMALTKGKLKVSKSIMHEILYNKMSIFGRDAIGGDMAQDMLFDGVRYQKLNGMDVLVTSKETVCDYYDQWIFTEPEFYGKSYTYEDVKMVTDTKDDIELTFFAHECIGGVIANRAGVAKITYTLDTTQAGNATYWTDAIPEASESGSGSN